MTPPDDRTKAAQVQEGRQDEMTREHTARICDRCYRLDGEMCHNPSCVFCRRTMKEVGDILDVLLIRPVVYGERLDLCPIGEPTEIERLRRGQSILWDRIEEHARIIDAAGIPKQNEYGHDYTLEHRIKLLAEGTKAKP